MISFLKFQWSSSIIRIALLSGLSYPLILTNYTGLFFYLLNKFRFKELSSPSLIQYRVLHFLPYRVSNGNIFKLAWQLLLYENSA
jgi:hypothetical protein